MTTATDLDCAPSCELRTACSLHTLCAIDKEATERGHARALEQLPAAIRQVIDERARQDATWGEQNHPDGTGPDWPALYVPAGGTAADARDLARRLCQGLASHGAVSWGDIIREEVCEALAEADPRELRRELVQVAAIAVAWIEAIDRRTA